MNKPSKPRKRRKRKASGKFATFSKIIVGMLSEYSKIILLFVMLTYFVGLGFGIYAVNKILLDYPEWAIQALIALFGYVGTPTATAIGFYAWKAKAENVVKIKKENPQETEGVTVDPSTIL